MQRRSGVVHAEAECRDCGWSTGYYKNALANAAQHANAPATPSSASRPSP